MQELEAFEEQLVRDVEGDASQQSQPLAGDCSARHGYEDDAELVDAVAIASRPAAKRKYDYRSSDLCEHARKKRQEQKMLREKADAADRSNKQTMQLQVAQYCDKPFHKDVIQDVLNPVQKAVLDQHLACRPAVKGTKSGRQR